MKIDICSARVGPYVGFTYWPVRYVQFPREVREYSPEEACMWGVYTKNVQGGTEWLADCETEQEAIELIALLESLITERK